MMPSRPPSFKPSFKPSKPTEVVRKNDFDKTRTTSTARGYGYKWQKARVKFLSENPLCLICQAKKIVKAATIVDHIIAHKGDAHLFWNQDNWQPLCVSCHSRKTATEDSGFASGGRGGKSLPPPPL